MALKFYAISTIDIIDKAIKHLTNAETYLNEKLSLGEALNEIRAANNILMLEANYLHHKEKKEKK